MSARDELTERLADAGVLDARRATDEVIAWLRAADASTLVSLGALRDIDLKPLRDFDGRQRALGRSVNTTLEDAFAKALRPLVPEEDDHVCH